MELKMYTPVSPKFVFQKVRFKVLHYNQYDFIRQHPGFSKDQASMLKSLLLIISSSDIVTHYNGCIQGEKYFFFIKVGAANIRLKLDYRQSGVDRIQKNHIYHNKQCQTFYRKINNCLVVKALDSQSRGPVFKPLGGSKVGSPFHPSEVDKMSTRNFWELSGKK